jgi:chemotaxis protein CheD
MKSEHLLNLCGRTVHGIHIGGVFASHEPSVVRTVLGSCISACLFDPVARVGGMNHFMLPDGNGDEMLSTRYGVHSMEVLINACMNAGADRRFMQAKIFGGGHVLRIAMSASSVPQRNIQFIRRFLIDEDIPIVAHDLGGKSAREVMFFTDTGRTLMKRLGDNASKQKAAVVHEESAAQNNWRIQSAIEESNITLF